MLPSPIEILREPGRVGIEIGGGLVGVFERGEGLASPAQAALAAVVIILSTIRSSRDFCLTGTVSQRGPSPF